MKNLLLGLLAGVALTACASSPPLRSFRLTLPGHEPYVCDVVEDDDEPEFRCGPAILNAFPERSAEPAH